MVSIVFDMYVLFMYMIGFYFSFSKSATPLFHRVIHLNILLVPNKFILD